MSSSRQSRVPLYPLGAGWPRWAVTGRGHPWWVRLKADKSYAVAADGADLVPLVSPAAPGRSVRSAPRFAGTASELRGLAQWPGGVYLRERTARWASRQVLQLERAGRPRPDQPASYGTSTFDEGPL